MKPFSEDKIKRKRITNKLRAINESNIYYVNNKSKALNNIV